MNLLDTHFHLDLWPTPNQLLQRIERDRIYTIAVTNTPSVFKHTFELTNDSKYVKAALGLHPELVFERHLELSQFHELIDLTKYIGEIGLDYSKNDKSNHNLQRKVFESIVDGCINAKEKKILTIHSRRAEKDVVDIIGSGFRGKAILHWYSGNLTELRKAIDYGFYFSVNCAMVSSKSGQKIINEIPLYRLLTESDGPFIHNGFGEPTSPVSVRGTIEKLAKLLNKDALEVQKLIYSNFKKVLH